MEIWEKFKQLGESIPIEEWDDLPRDLSQNFEQYQMEAMEMELQKQKNLRSKKWLDHIRSMECLFCPSDETEPHHIRKHTDGGTGLKPSDFYAIPVCREHHNILHNERIPLSFFYHIAAMMFRWLEAKGEYKLINDTLKGLFEVIIQEIEND